MSRSDVGATGVATLGNLLAIWPNGKMKMATTITERAALAGGWLSALLWLIVGGATVQASTNVNLVWEASSGAGLAGYHIYYGTIEGQYTEQTSVGIQTSATVSNLLEGLTYYFVVTAFNTLGVESEPSNEIVFSVPQSLPVTVALNWNQNLDPNLAGYYVYYGSASGQYTQKTNVGNVTHYTLPGLVAGQTYYFVVTASDQAGRESQPSDEVSFQAPIAPSIITPSQTQPAETSSPSSITLAVNPLPASQPIRITALTKLNDGSMSLSWDSVPQAGYQVWYKNNFNESQWTALSQTVAASGSSTSWIDNSAREKEMRFYRVSLVE